MKLKLDGTTLDLPCLPQSLDSFNQLIRMLFNLSKDATLVLRMLLSDHGLVVLCCDRCLMNLKPESTVFVTLGRFLEIEPERENDSDYKLLTGQLKEDSLVVTPFIESLSERLRVVATQRIFDVEDREQNTQREMLRMAVLWGKGINPHLETFPSDLEVVDSIVTKNSDTYPDRIYEVLKNCPHLNTWSRKDLRTRYNLTEINLFFFPNSHGKQSKPGFERLFLSGEQKEQILNDYEEERINLKIIMNKYCISDRRFYKWRRARKDGKKMKDYVLEEEVSLPMKAAWQELYAEMQGKDKLKLN